MLMKSLFLTAALAGLAPTADAGGLNVRVWIDSERGVRVGLGHDRHRQRDRHVRHRRIDHRDRHVHRVRTRRVAYRVWIPERHERVVVPARYEYRRDPCGRRVRVLVRRSYVTTRCIPGRYEIRYRTVRDDCGIEALRDRSNRRDGRRTGRHRR